MPSTLLAHPTFTTSAVAAPGPGAPRPDGVMRAAHWVSSSLPSRLNREWAQLCGSAAGDRAVRGWATPSQRRGPLTGLGGVAGLGATVELLQSAEVASGRRDAVLVGLLERAQEGDQLAGRVVLQTMLPAAVRIAVMVTRRPDVQGGRDEAFALVLGALWQVIATYPVSRRRARVPANLYFDTLAIVCRGHTSNTRRVAPVVQELSCADVAALADPGQLDVDQDDLSGPADAQLCTVLAWAVRSAVVRLDEARLLARVYGLDGGRVDAGVHLAAELGVTWPTLRQRCHRIARRVGHAAIAAGIDGTAQRGAVLRAARPGPRAICG